MATPYVTGPAHVFVGLGSGGTPIYLGTCERYPKILIRPANEPHFNDMGGKVPFDMAHMGEEGFTSGDFNRFNETTYAVLASRPRGPAGVRGLNVAGEIGALYLTEGFAYGVWVSFPYVAKPVFAAAGMPAGYHFLASYLVGPDELEPLGTTPRKIRLIWHHLRAFGIPGISIPQGVTLQSSIGAGEVFELYNHDMSAINGIPVN
jgi:hypothetical protein